MFGYPSSVLTTQVGVNQDADSWMLWTTVDLLKIA